MKNSRSTGERKFQALFEHALEAIVIADDDGVYVDANPAACRLFGLPREELIGCRIRDFAPPDFDFDGAWQRFRQERQEVGLFTLVRRDGEERQVEYDAVADFIPGRHLSVMRDVTEREAAEQEREEALHHLGERVKEATLLKEAARLLNRPLLPVEQLLGELAALIPPAWQYPAITEAAITYDGRRFQTTGFVRTEWRQEATFAGEQGLIEVVLREAPAAGATPFLAEEQSTLETLAGILQADLERRQVEGRYRFMLETMSQGVIYVERSGQIVAANPAVEEILGFPTAQMVGINIHDPRWYPQGDDGNTLTGSQSAVGIALREGVVVKNQVVRIFNPAAGEYRWLRVDAAPHFRAGEAQPYLVYAIFDDITERRRSQSQLRLQAQLLDGVREIVVAADREMNLVYWGQGAEAAYGYKAEEVLGKPYLEVARPLDLEGAREDLVAARDMQQWQGEALHRRRDGTPFWVAGSISPVRDEADEVWGYVGVGRDVTERKQSERELEAIAVMAGVMRGQMTLQDMYDVLLEQLLTLYGAEGVAISMVDEPAGEIVIEEVRGQWQVLEGFRLRTGEGVTGRVVESGRPFRTADLAAEEEFRNSDLFKDGHYGGVCIPLLVDSQGVGALWLVRPEPFSETEMQVLLATADIAATAIHRAALYERLEQQTLQLRSMMETVDEGLILLDEQQRVLLANPAGLAYLAMMNGTAVVGETVEQLHDLPLARLLVRPGAVREVTVDLPATTQFEVVVEPIRGSRAAGSGGWVLLIRDVTEARRTQAYMLQQDRLASVGQLAAGIAHDFNNIMAAIVLYSQSLQHTLTLNPKQAKALNIINAQAYHATTLIRQILDFSRRSEMERGPLPIVPFFKELVKLWERTLPENINLVFSGNEGYVVEADPTSLQQAMMNLVINARDAMPEGGRLSIQLDELEVTPKKAPPLPDMESGRWLRIRVEDTGPGIDEGQRPYIFDPFFTTKPPGEGTGLGLAQVYGIVRQHEGFITVENRRGGGACFLIYLPLLPDETPWEQELPVWRPQRVRGEICLLVVEDEVAVREALVDALASVGYRVLEAGNGTEALAVLDDEEGTVDLVITDLIMPEMGGALFLQQMLEAYRWMRVLVISGYQMEKDERQLLQNERVAWLQKPFSLDRLLERIEEMLGNGGDRE